MKVLLYIVYYFRHKTEVQRVKLAGQCHRLHRTEEEVKFLSKYITIAKVTRLTVGRTQSRETQAGSPTVKP